jgi:CRP/FNR family transcriptional regulator
MSYAPEDSELYQLLLTGRLLKLGKGQVVDPMSDRSMLNYLESGYIKRYLITHEGNKSVQNIYGPGDIFPLTPTYNRVFETEIYKGPEQYYYESMTDIVIYVLDINTLADALAQNPVIYKDLFYEAGVRLNAYIHRMEDRSLRTGLYRTAHMVAFLARQFGEPVEGGIEIQLPLTKNSLAEILDLTRETVSRELNRLKARGFIEPKKKIIVKDLDALMKFYR